MFAGDQNGLQDDPRLKAIFEALELCLTSQSQELKLEDLCLVPRLHWVSSLFPHVNPGSCQVISEAYILEDDKDCLEMHVGAVQPGERVLVIDDLVATGGTRAAAILLGSGVGAETCRQDDLVLG
ncbi:Adenine phosphoribosyltransferase 1 [Hibiscus syriacus]|uniref:adenine phosphoribosyltransferase n=1 Tax=Hibiscus syriacus TaxID=106335 RepID=A0A6A3B3Y7_HIBSY|nr:Adenine phosphoribosyltransferase 1 [Hibiscus syriacus]